MIAEIRSEPGKSDDGRGREAALDIAKGLAIVAVVAGHVAGGLISAGVSVVSASWLNVLTVFVYTWHLQTFLLVSGLFVARGVDREGVGRYLLKRMPTLLWIYLLWTLIQNTAQWLLAGVVNHPVTAERIALVWFPTGQMWYLPLLISLIIVASISRCWRLPYGSWIGVLAAVVTSLVVADNHTRWFGTQGWGLAFFFMVGVAVGRRRLVAYLLSSPMLVLGIGSFLGGFVGIASTRFSGTGNEFSDRGIAMMASLLVVGGVLSLSEVLARSSLKGGLSFLGRASLPIFVAHVIAAAGIRVLLFRLGASNVLVQLVLGTLFGVVLPLALYSVSRPWRLAWLFELPRRRLGRHNEGAAQRMSLRMQ